ncbi:Cytochrome c biogenesis ATP-binding export protein CcmA [Commensalibacter sp. Nvir]|uniref:heme ABC exporter ATP-binding protein CcmA n=1 Tax=Commensalibacter sp. Nvir TaxID=3069817 RepID=UPI002D47D50D|nr:Cytochrome c biogenesis ATP-binding export protein CcmA [Commensalibacter sp. Nvir]
MNVLIAKNLGIRRDDTLIFREIGFSLKTGESLLIQGANGSGKTTLLRLLAGLKKPDLGNIFWNQSSIYNNLSQYMKNIAFLGHSDALKPYLTLKENLNLFRQIHKTNITPALQALGIFPLAEIPVRLLSSGQKRRAALARLLLAPAKIWLLDEFSIGLDKETLIALGIIFETFKKEGGIIVASTHVTLPLKFNHTLRLQHCALTSHSRL